MIRHTLNRFLRDRPKALGKGIRKTPFCQGFAEPKLA